MGLDLVVEGCPKPGHEHEWKKLLKRSFADEGLSEAETARFQEICIPSYERIGAPRVGYDDAANEWILKARNVNTPEDAAAVLKEFEGYYVLRLVECDGVPKYSNGALYVGTDETSFRGAFLQDCQDVLSKSLLNDAWNHKFPEAAVAYGKLCLRQPMRQTPQTKHPHDGVLFFHAWGWPKSPSPSQSQSSVTL
jgi:hypothetical protein